VALCGLTRREDAVGRGVSAFLYSWKSLGRSIQPGPDGRWYVEACPAYIQTVDGMTRWSASKGWSAVRSVLGWMEASIDYIRTTAIRLRRLARGVRRGGRHLLLDPWMVRALDEASGLDRFSTCVPSKTIPAPEQALRLLTTNKKTAAIRCPWHGDRSPSLVLWSNGGAMCMSCRWRGAWVVQGGDLRLFSASEKRHGKCNTPHRHNKRSQHSHRVDPVGPVGGCVSGSPVCENVVGALLSQYQDHKTGTWERTRSRGHLLRGGLLNAMKNADTRAGWRSVVDRASHASWLCGGDLPGDVMLPDLLVSVSTMGRRSWSEPWVPWLQRWMLVDLDDVQGLDRCGDSLGEMLASHAAQDSEVGSEVAVVRTGPTGVQVWVSLRKPRHNPKKWCQLPEVQGWHHRLGKSLLKVCRDLGATGGKVDRSACAAGRFGRRPGWRWKNGEPYRSRLLAVLE
jgi:hypothetical protein